MAGWLTWQKGARRVRRYGRGRRSRKHGGIRTRGEARNETGVAIGKDTSHLLLGWWLSDGTGLGTHTTPCPTSTNIAHTMVLTTYSGERRERRRVLQMRLRKRRSSADEKTKITRHEHGENAEEKSKGLSSGTWNSTMDTEPKIEFVKKGR